ncbi:MAG TPA: hypothetical protein VFJ51_03865 [Nitrososphaeraceae archaeon]|nr:hypothetical protein [Nitrososphaeraceae archaeon]
MSSIGENERGIDLNTLQISEPTISRDLAYLRQQSKVNIQKYIDERSPEEYEKCLTGLNLLLKESWNISQEHNINRREKIQALSLAKEVYSAKLDLLTNCEVVDDLVKFINNQKQEGKEQEEAEYNKQQQNEDKKELSSSYSFSTEEEEQEQEEAEQEEEEEERRRQVIGSVNFSVKSYS